METNGNAPAYPIQNTQMDGLTKRELFAAMAMEALLHNVDLAYVLVPGIALEIADDMIAELAKDTNDKSSK